MSGRASGSVPRPKRTGEQFAPEHFSNDGGDEDAAGSPSSKKPRFDYRNPSTLAADAPEEDAILELDEIGKGSYTKRNAVNLDGFESDSSNENFDARAEAKAKKAKKEAKANVKQTAPADDEDEDMFADEGDANDDMDGADGEEDDMDGKKKKNVRFLEDDEIEGQIDTSKSGGKVDVDFRKIAGQQATEEESSSESGSDEERDRIGDDVDEEVGAGGKKKHAPRLDAFNMKAEGEEGRFDESGNYVRKAVDPDAKHDIWLDGVSKKEMKKAKEAHEKREEDRRKRNMADDAILTSDLLKTLIMHLEKDETVLEALQRAGKDKRKKTTPKWQKNKRKTNSDSMDVDQKYLEETRRKEVIEAITGAADQLLMRGQAEIYDAERQLLIRQYRRETGEDWVEPARPNADGGDPEGARQWEYRWSDARDGGDVHGPYDGPTMVAWNEAGYFGEGVEFRVCGNSEWTRVATFV